MISDEHLQHLVELRRNLMREVGRLDLVISQESAYRSCPGLRSPGDSELTWEEALHEAKILAAGEHVGLGMEA